MAALMKLEQYMYLEPEGKVVKLWEDGRRPMTEDLGHSSYRYIRVTSNDDWFGWALPTDLRSLNVLEQVSLGLDEPATMELVVKLRVWVKWGDEHYSNRFRSAGRRLSNGNTPITNKSNWRSL